MFFFLVLLLFSHIFVTTAIIILKCGLWLLVSDMRSTAICSIIFCVVNEWGSKLLYREDDNRWRLEDLIDELS